MDDLISRQAAIDAIYNACGKIDCDKMDKCEKLQLPPANCSEFPNNSDTISRQAAIRWVKTECNPYGKPTLDFESGKKVIEHLEQMPPAEERKAGTWKEFRGNKNMCICQSCGFMVNKSLLYDYTEKDPLVFKYCPSCGSYNGGAKRR